MKNLLHTKRGTNSHTRHYRVLGLKDKTWLSLFYLTIFMFTTAQIGMVIKDHEAVDLLSPVPMNAYASYSEPAKITDKQLEEREATQNEIEAYIRTIFGTDARVAIAVSHNECNPKHRDYPACVLHTKAEYSVGIFQINLYNENHWIHAKKVPGATMDEKIEWLKNPYNNTLIAFKIFSDSGFNPWTAYSSGNYLNDL